MAAELPEECAFAARGRHSITPAVTHRNYRRYLLICLAAIYAFNFMDLLTFGMALQSIKVSLKLSDTELGVLSGLPFSLFYSTIGVGLGWWADVGNRVAILSITRVLWAVFVVLTGRAGSFMQMFGVRIAVAAGESGCLPPAYSLIGDCFPRQERARAFGIFNIGIPLSTVLGFFAAGWLIQHYGWRETFTIMGMPGFALSIVAWLTLKEPRNQRSATAGPAGSATAAGVRVAVAIRDRVPQAPWATFRSLWGNATYRNLLLAFVTLQFYATGLGQWQAAFFIRSYGMAPGELGAWLAIASGIPAMIGSPLGGAIASRWAGSNERVQLVFVSVIYCFIATVWPCVYLTRNDHIAFALMAASTLVASMSTASVMSAMQAVVPSRMRAVSIMIVFLFANLVGFGLGPLLTGVLSDALRPRFGIDSLRYALVLMSPWSLLYSWFTLRASRTAATDVARNVEH